MSDNISVRTVQSILDTHYNLWSGRAEQATNLLADLLHLFGGDKAALKQMVDAAKELYDEDIEEDEA